MTRLLMAGAFCALAMTAACAAPIDRGGPILNYLAAVHRLDAAGAEKQIAGDCMSACTLYLKARRVCAYRDATFWFHGAHDLRTGRYSPEWTQVMRDYLPPRVERLAASRGAFDSLAYVVIPASDLFRVGVRPCTQPARKP